MGDFNTEEGLKGAAGGALTGAGVGTAIMPGIGTAVGAVGGGLIGLLGGGLSGNGETDDEKKRRQMLMDYYRSIQGRQAPQMGAASLGQLSDVRGRQLSLADQLDAISRGQGPSLAEQQLRSATDRNVAQQASFANSGRGGPMAAARAANNSARLGAIAAQDAAAGRIAEGNAARQLLGLNLHGIRDSDESMSRFNASAQNEQAYQNMFARLKMMGMNDEVALQAMGQLGQQNAQVASRPTMGDQLLAGGAGAFSQGMAMRNAGGSTGSLPQGGGINQIWRQQLQG